MARKIRSEYVYFRHEGAETREVFFRINPIAIRFQQGNKGSVVDTLGGYFREVFYSQDQQYNGLLLPDLVIEGETGIAYRQELKVIDWIWRHHGQPKRDGSPADTYFYDLIQVGPFQQIERDEVKVFLIEILNFAWDESVNDPYRIRFTFRCKILRDYNWSGSQRSTPVARQVPGIPVGGVLGQRPGLTNLLGSLTSQLDGLLADLNAAVDPQLIQSNLNAITNQIARLQERLTAQPQLLSQEAQAAIRSVQHGLAQVRAGILGAGNPAILENGIRQVQGQVANLNARLASTLGITSNLIPASTQQLRARLPVDPPPGLAVSLSGAP